VSLKKKQKIKKFKKAKMQYIVGQFVAIFKFLSGQLWPISADTVANFSFSYLVTLGWGGAGGQTEKYR